METDTFKVDPIIWWFPHAVLYIFREGPTGYTWELVPEDSSGPSTHGTAVTPAAAVQQALARVPAKKVTK